MVYDFASKAKPMKNVNQNLPYQEGDWFAVPLRSGGYGVGLVARAPGNGIVLGCFFGTRYDTLPKEKKCYDAIQQRRIFCDSLW